MYSGQEKKGAKQGLNTKDGAQRRERQLQGVRQRNTVETMKQLRRMETDTDDSLMVLSEQAAAAGHVFGDPQDVWSYNKSSIPDSIPLSLLPDCAQLVLHGRTPEEVYQGTLLIRKMLSVDRDPPFTQVIESGVVPTIVEFLSRNDYPDLQFEAAWALTNIAAGTTENTNLLVRCGAVPKFVALLSSPSAQCRDQAAWALGNLGGEGAPCRDVALSCGAMPALLTVITTAGQPINIMRNATWAVSNLCRGRPHPELEYVAMAVPVLGPLLYHPDSQVVIDAAWGLSYISDGPSERVQVVLVPSIVSRVVELMSFPSPTIKTPAIRIIGNIASGDDEQTQTIINAGALSAFVDLLRHQKRAIRKEACWTVSNIAAGKTHQIDALINAGVFVPLMECLMAPELDVKKEAVWTVANIAFCGTKEHTQYLISIGIISPLCDTLRAYDSKITSVALEALQVMLQIGEDEKNAGVTAENNVVLAVVDCGGLENIEQLQNHADKKVYQHAIHILEEFFSAEDSMGGLGENREFGMEGDMPPVGAGGDHFAFLARQMRSVPFKSKNTVNKRTTTTKRRKQTPQPPPSTSGKTQLINQINKTNNSTKKKPTKKNQTTRNKQTVNTTNNREGSAGPDILRGSTPCSPFILNSLFFFFLLFIYYYFSLSRFRCLSFCLCLPLPPESEREENETREARAMRRKNTRRNNTRRKNPVK
eukprot:gene5865-4187_t